MKNVLFDLDGTLTDPMKGIINSIFYALQKMEKPLPESSELIEYIGPPLIDSFLKIFGNDNIRDAQLAVELYRENYRTNGQYENRVYSGIKPLLSTLRGEGYSLFVATSKPYVFAKSILEHFNLHIYFKCIYGSELSGERGVKEDLIHHIIDTENLLRTNTVMVGDRKFDVIGAHKNGIACIGVTYGYGSSGELEDAGADYFASSPVNLLNIIKSL